MEYWSWLLDESASTFGPAIDRLYYVILIVTGIIFLITEVALVWFIFKYRHREGHKADYIHGNTRAEVVWTAIPAVIVLAIALASRGVWAQVKDPEEFPPDALPVMIMASQFEYPLKEAQIDAFERDGVIHLPAVIDDKWIERGREACNRAPVMPTVAGARAPDYFQKMRELDQKGTLKDFHDRVYKIGFLPVVLVREEMFHQLEEEFGKG